MAESIAFEKSLFGPHEPLQPSALVDSQGHILSANDAMKLLLRFFPNGDSIYSVLDEIRLSDIFRTYLLAPPAALQPLQSEDNSYLLNVCSYGANHLLHLFPHNKRPDTEAILRRLMHDVRTPLSTALMALSNLDFILEEESAPVAEEDYSPKEFTDSATQALEEIKENLEIISSIIKKKKDSLQQVDFVALLETVELPASAKTNIEPGQLRLPLYLKAVKKAINLLIKIFKNISPAAQPLNLHLDYNKESRSYRLELTNVPPGKSQFNFLKPLPYAHLPENIQIQLAIAEHILFKNNMILTGKIYPETHIFHLIIFIPTEEQ